MSILTELEQIRLRDPERILHPEAVVEFARNSNTELHSHFDWDDHSAAEAYRLQQARQVIRVNVRLLDQGDGETAPIRAYVAIIDEDGDRGYQDIRVVLKSPSKRRALIESILKRISATLTLHPLPELDEIRRAVEHVRIEHGLGGYAPPPAKEKSRKRAAR